MQAFKEFEVGWDSKKKRPVLLSADTGTPWESAQFTSRSLGIVSWIGSETNPDRSVISSHRVKVLAELEVSGETIVENNKVRSEEARIISLHVLPNKDDEQEAHILLDWKMRWGQLEVVYAHPSDPEHRAEIDLQELESLLLKRYKVSRLTV